MMSAQKFVCLSAVALLAASHAGVHAAATQPVPSMKVVERWTLMNENTIRYEAEITDPATFTRPWKMSMLMYRRLGEDARLQQFKCVEFVEELMYGDLRKEPLK